MKPATSLQKPKAPPNGAMKAKAVCKIIGCNYQTLKNAIAAGLPVEPDGLINLQTARDWFQSKEATRTRNLELLAAKKQAEIDKFTIQRQMQELELAKAKGEVVSRKEYLTEFGRLLSGTWMEMQALPARLQSAMPEAVGLEGVATSIINDTALRLQHFAREKGVKIK